MEASARGSHSLPRGKAATEHAERLGLRLSSAAFETSPIAESGRGQPQSRTLRDYVAGPQKCSQKNLRSLRTIRDVASDAYKHCLVPFSATFSLNPA